jgi:hypothetical protein
MDHNKRTVEPRSPSTTGNGGLAYSFLKDPCCLNVHIPGFDDDDEDIPKPVATGAGTSDRNNVKSKESLVGRSPEHPFDEEGVGDDGTEVSFLNKSVDAILDAIPQNDMTCCKGASQDVVLQYPIVSVEVEEVPEHVKENEQAIIDIDKDTSWWRQMKQRNLVLFTRPISSMDVEEDSKKGDEIADIENNQDKCLPWWRRMKQQNHFSFTHPTTSMDVEEEPEKEDEKPVLENDPDKGLPWWRGKKQRNLVLLTMANVVIFIIIVSLIGKHSKRRKREMVSSASTDGNDSTDNNIITSTNHSNADNTTNNPSDSADRHCRHNGALLRDGIVLTPNEILQQDQFVCSPSQEFMVGISTNLGGDLAVYETATNQVLWSANVTGADRLVMQQDGNIMLEDDAGVPLFSTNFELLDSGAWVGSIFVQLVISDDGLLKIEQPLSEENASLSVMLWLEGAPNGEVGPIEDLSFPVRGTFYYPTYNDASSWEGSRFQPSLGSYSSSDPAVIQNHVAALTYGKMDLVISSWSGQDAAAASHRPRTRMLMDETVKQDSPIKWTFYYESAKAGEPSLDVIQSDLEYLKTWFTWDKTWAHMDGKPVLFVNNGGGCDVAERWMDATNNEWYIVLRIFAGFEDCQVQPNSWHEERDRNDSNGADDLQGYYFYLSPGEWHSGSDEPTIERLTGSQWCLNVRKMVYSEERWQLIVSFNNADTGTSIESSLDWESDSGFGLYLDCLHDDRLM